MELSPFKSAAMALCALLLSGQSVASESLWLSDVSPHAGHGGGAHSHGGPVQIRKGIYYKHLWLRLGDTPQDSGYVQQASQLSQLVLLDTEGKVTELPIRRDKEHGLFNVDFAMPKEGFYNAYVTHQWVNGDTREVQIAKAEVLKHSCREGHDNVQEKMPPRHDTAIPLEIVRERAPKENFHSLLAYGDTATFLVLREGQPLQGAKVTLTSSQGWSKSVTSDSEGLVHYTMIRDYYPRWSMFNKRYSQPYLVSAVYTASESGELDGKSYQHTTYQASFAGNYYPSPRDYESYAYGLSFGLFALIATGIGVYVYRRRRNRPFREVRFDE